MMYNVVGVVGMNKRIKQKIDNLHLYKINQMECQSENVTSVNIVPNSSRDGTKICGKEQ